jgi:hypothetical protein
MAVGFLQRSLPLSLPPHPPLPLQVLRVDQNLQLLDVEYHTDGVVEKDVPFPRAKLASHRSALAPVLPLAH